MKYALIFLFSHVIVSSTNASEAKWFCAYNSNAKLDAGIYFDRDYNKKSAIIDVLQSCQTWERKNCKKRFVRCEQETRNDGYEYLCQSTKNDNAYEGRGNTQLEAVTRAMKDCRWRNGKKCRSRFLRCSKVKERSIWDHLPDIF